MASSRKNWSTGKVRPEMREIQSMGEKNNLWNKVSELTCSMHIESEKDTTSG